MPTTLRAKPKVTFSVNGAVTDNPCRSSTGDVFRFHWTADAEI